MQHGPTQEEHGDPGSEDEERSRPSVAPVIPPDHLRKIKANSDEFPDRECDTRKLPGSWPTPDEGDIVCGQNSANRNKRTSRS